MNFAQMLMNPPSVAINHKPWKCRVSQPNGPSQEAIDKQVETKRRIRHNKWRNHFDQFPDNTATTNQIAELTKQSNGSTWQTLYRLFGEGVLEKTGTKSQTVWKWILD